MNIKINIDRKRKNEIKPVMVEMFEAHKLDVLNIHNRECYDETNKAITKRLSDKKLELTPDEKCYAVALIRQRCQNIIDENKLEVTLPKWPAKFIEEASFRDKEWFEISTSVHVWIDRLKAELTVQNLKRDISADHWLGLALLSSVLYGGLYNIKNLRLLHKALLSGITPLRSINNRAYFALGTPIDSGNYNLRRDGLEIRNNHWFPDAVSLGLIHKFLRAKQKTKPMISVASKQSIYQLIYYTLFKDRASVTIKNLNTLSAAAVYAGTTRLGFTYSEMLLNVGMGQYDTLSADEHSLHNLFGVQKDILEKEEEVYVIESEKEEDKIIYETISKQLIELPKIKEFYEAMLDAVEIKTGKGTAEIQRSLTAVLEEYKHLPASLLIFPDWLHLRAGEIAPKTLKNYFHNVAPLWIPEMLSQDLDELNAVDLLYSYETMLDRVELSTTLPVKIAQIKSIHEFGVKRYGLPKINDMGRLMVNGDGKKSYVRTQILNHRDIHKATNKLLKSSWLTEELKIICRVTILSFRTAMRRGETLKIRMKDIEPGGDWMVYVVNNKWGNNKSDSSRRKLPLKILLHDDELADFKAFYRARVKALKKHGQLDKNLLLFGTGSSNLRLSDNYVTTAAQILLRNACRNPRIVFHTLRHSAANFMHAVIEQDFELAGLISGFDDTKLKEIRSFIVGPENTHLSQYWDLATFMGHSSPRETFRSYLHLSDIISANIILKAPFPIKVASLSVLSRGQEGIQQSSSRIFEDKKLDLIAYMVKYNDDLYSIQEKVKPSLFDGDYEHHALHEKLSIGKEYDFTLVRGLLEEFKKGNELEEISTEYLYDQHRLSNIMERAKYVFSMKASKGGQRHEPETDREAEEQGLNLVPRLPKLPVCQKEAKDMLAKLLSISGVKPKKWASRTIECTRKDVSYIKVKTHRDLQLILALGKELFPTTRWEVVHPTHNPPKKNQPKPDDVKYWESALPAGFKLTFEKKVTPDNGYGQIRIYLRQKNWRKDLAAHNKKHPKKKYKRLSSDQLKYVSQMAYIMLE